MRGFARIPRTIRSRTTRDTCQDPISQAVAGIARQREAFADLDRHDWSAGHVALLAGGDATGRAGSKRSHDAAATFCDAAA